MAQEGPIRALRSPHPTPTNNRTQSFFFAGFGGRRESGGAVDGEKTDWSPLPDMIETMGKQLGGAEGLLCCCVAVLGAG